MQHLILLNSTGDVTIAWEDSENENMRNMIKTKLEKGCSFFILEKKCFGLFNSKIKVRNIDDIKGNSITIGDDSIMELFDNGIISAGKTPKMEYSTSKKTTCVDEIMNTNSVMINKVSAG